VQSTVEIPSDIKICGLCQYWERIENGSDKGLCKRKVPYSFYTDACQYYKERK